MKERGASSRSLVHGFVESCGRFPERDALFADKHTLTYRQLGNAAGRLSATIRKAQTGRSSLVALLAHRSVRAYAGVLGTLLAGNGYVPLNPKFPARRLERMLTLSGCDVVIVGDEGLERLREIIPNVADPIAVIVSDSAIATEFCSEFPMHRFLVCQDDPAELEAPEVAPDSVAYLLFTSGSTGEPKGVAVSHRNVGAYVDYVARTFEVNENDRFSQHFDLTFDLSVHDMFVCWERGACLCSVPEKSVIAPAKFIKDQALTMWFSVPSAVGFMERMGMLKPGSFPSLRCSLSCGEPLPADFARIWQEAAPGCFVENLYGPTEATIAITRYRWDSTESPKSCVSGIVPIGGPFDRQQARVVDATGSPVAPGETGELVLGGSQVTGSYWNDSEETQERFVTLPALSGGVWYRTGDLAREDHKGCLYFLGRMDDQVKIRGYRVELQEIDHAIRNAAGTQEAVAVAWPIRQGRRGRRVVCVLSSARRAQRGRAAHGRSALLRRGDCSFASARMAGRRGGAARPT